MPATRTRRRRATGNDVVDNLNGMINDLIKENRKLRRQVEKLSASATGATSRAVETGLRGIQRRLQRALSDGATTTRGRAASTSAGRRTRVTASKPRKPVSPEVAEKRRQALAKAREARKAKRAAAASE